ncbi:MAG: metallophosphoesterase [Bacteroidota bacterium]
MKNFLRSWKSGLPVVLVIIVTACTTLPEPMDPAGEDLSFVVVGDVQQGMGIFSQLAIHIGKLEPVPRAAFFLGDYMARPGLEIEWYHFWKYASPITEKMPVFLARGNHEGNSPEDNCALRQYGRFPEGLFYRSIRIEELVFLILDSHEEGDGNFIPDQQCAWLNTELEHAEQDSAVQFIFVFMHHSLYPQGFHKGNGLFNAGEIDSLFQAHCKVKIVFSGHDHLFNRLVNDSINYIISGGGGAYLHHGYGGDYHHFVKVSIFREEQRINIKTIGVFNETVADFNL